MKTARKIIFSLLLTSAAISTKITAQGGAVYINQEWQDPHGNPTFNPILNPFGFQWSNSVVNGSGEIFTVGHTNVSGQGENIYLTKHDPDGNVVFSFNYNSSGTQNDYGLGLCLASNGDILISGTTDNGGSTNYDAVILRVDPSGSLLNSVIKDRGGMNDFAVGILEGPGGNIFVAANAEASPGIFDYWALKLNPSLSFVGDNIYDFTGLQDIAIGIELTASNDIALIGASFSGLTSCDYAMAMFDPNMTYLSDKRNNLPGTALDQAISFCKDASNNTYITGKAWNGTNFDIKTVKITSAFATAWTTTTDVNGLDDVPSSIAVDASGNVIVGGYATNASNLKEMIYMKYNSSGTVLWQHTLPSADPTGDASIQKIAMNPTNGNIYFLATELGGSGLKQTLVGKIKPNGERNWLRNIKDATNDILPSDIKWDTDGIYAITILDPAAATYQTTKFSELELDTSAVFGPSRPERSKNYLLVTFQHNALDAAKINNRDLQHGTVSDFITSTALGNLIEMTGIREIGYYKCHKVFPWMVMDDSLSITRSGREIKIYPHYSTFGILLPGGVHDSVPLISINGAVQVIRNAQYNRYAYLDVGANDTEYTNGNSAGLVNTTVTANANINVEPAWDLSVGDQNVRVGIFDTGVNFKHQDFGNGTFAGSKIAGGFNYQGNVPLSTTTSNDKMGHGTAVADKIGALRDNNFAIAGIAGGNGGANKGVALYDMKISEVGTDCNFTVTTFATEKDLANAIVQGAVNNTVTGSGLIQNIQNHSWGGIPLYGDILQAFITAYQNEVLMVVSSGNFAQSYSTTCGGYQYPASYKDNIVMKVGANNNTGARAIFSECDHRLDFIAPGTHDLYSSLTNTGSATTDTFVWVAGNNVTCTNVIDGTSFAAPHAAGSAALMLSYANNTFMPNGLFPEDVEQLMQLGANDLTASPNAPGYDPETGWGRINIGQTLGNYYFPGYLVLHHTFTVSASSAYTVGGIFENSCMAETKFGQPKGQFAKLKRYKITGTNSHTPPTGYTFIAGWERGAGSNMMGILSSSGFTASAILCYTNGVIFEEDRYIPDATNIIPSSPVTSVSAAFDGYIYEFYDPFTNLPIGWYPMDNTGSAVFAYTTYWRSLTVGIEEVFNDHSVVMFPNPTMDRVYIRSRLKEIDHIDVQVISSLGQLVFEQKNMYLSETNSIDVSHLTNGVYFAKLTCGKKTIVHKIVVAK